MSSRYLLDIKIKLPTFISQKDFSLSSLPATALFGRVKPEPKATTDFHQVLHNCNLNTLVDGHFWPGSTPRTCRAMPKSNGNACNPDKDGRPGVTGGNSSGRLSPAIPLTPSIWDSEVSNNQALVPKAREQGHVRDYICFSICRNTSACSQDR